MDHEVSEWRFYGAYPTPDIALGVRAKLERGEL